MGFYRGLANALVIATGFYLGIFLLWVLVLVVLDA